MLPNCLIESVVTLFEIQTFWRQFWLSSWKRRLWGVDRDIHPNSLCCTPSLKWYTLESLTRNLHVCLTVQGYLKIQQSWLNCFLQERSSKLGDKFWVVRRKFEKICCFRSKKCFFCVFLLSMWSTSCHFNSLITHLVPFSSTASCSHDYNSVALFPFSISPCSMSRVNGSKSLNLAELALSTAVNLRKLHPAIPLYICSSFSPTVKLSLSIRH